MLNYQSVVNPLITSNNLLHFLYFRSNKRFVFCFLKLIPKMPNQLFKCCTSLYHLNPIFIIPTISVAVKAGEKIMFFNLHSSLYKTFESFL